jgi:predicted GH43/DUF377 family glycosyl hydrolase
MGTIRDFDITMEFVRYSKNPILVPDPKLSFEQAAVYNPCAVVHKNKVYLIYRAEAEYYNKYVSCLCLAESSDGVHFRKYKNNPIIKPDRAEEKRGCEDPRIVKIGGVYYLTYTAYNGKNIAVSLATSKNLIHWKKHGVILKNWKSAQILEQSVNGEFLMLVGDKNIFIARSKNLKHWKLDNKPLISPRKNMFDSALVEVGPVPFIKNNQLVLIYNSADGLGHYHPCYCLLDINNPAKVLYRHNRPLANPQTYYELYGKVNYVIFAEGLVLFKNKFLLYYGAADKAIGVAEIK